MPLSLRAAEPTALPDLFDYSPEVAVRQAPLDAALKARFKALELGTVGERIPKPLGLGEKLADKTGFVRSPVSP
jgi:hypothetical protein